MITRCIPIDRRFEWEAALEGVPHAFGHTWESCHAMQLTTGLNTFLYSHEVDGVRVVCPIAERRFDHYTDIVTPYGFSGFVGTGIQHDWLEAWHTFVSRKQYVCGYIGLNPILSASCLPGIAEAQSERSVYVLDLTQPRAELINRLDDNRKRQLSHFDTLAREMTTDRGVLSEFFLSNYVEFHRSRGASSAYLFSRATMEFLLGLDNVLLVGAPRDSVQCVLMFAYTATVGEFLFNVSVPQGRRHSTPLLWFGVEWLQSIGVPMLNLGGGVREGDGVADFKRRFGATQMPLHCFREVYRPEVFTELCRRTLADPNDREGYFPPYRKR